jgi:hypothetical protein
MIANVRPLSLVAAAIALTTALAGCGGDGAAAGKSGGAMSVSVAEPAANATVAVPFTVAVTASVPLGKTESGKHHVHVWFDDNENDYQVVETPTVQITDLAPGNHVLHVSLRNSNHSPAGADTATPITVSGASGSSASSGPVTPGSEPEQPNGY